MKSDEILQQAANGNAEALAFLRAFAMRAHWVDDLADRDHAKLADGKDWYTPDIFAKHEADWLTVLASNSFFLTNRAQLVPVMILALAAWVDSHKVGPASGAVLKEQWQEVVWLVAWLTGGWAKMRETTLREFEVEIPIQFGALVCSTCLAETTPGDSREIYGKCYCVKCINSLNATSRKEAPNGNVR